MNDTHYKMGKSRNDPQGHFFDLPSTPDHSVEQGMRSRGYNYVAGVDEAGRGPLAGPVVAAAVILPIPCDIPGINDSKKLTAAQREELYEIIFQEAISVGIGISAPEIIDRHNILEATLMAMKAAVEALDPKPQSIIVDGISRVPTLLPQRTVKKGDARCVSIAAASIIAKVTRDRLMDTLHERYPHYGFNKHKGYGAQSHLKALKEHGPCEAHRLTFKGVKELIQKE